MKKLLPVVILVWLLLAQSTFASPPTPNSNPGSRAPDQAPGLNHFYVVLDADTFEAIKRSEWFAHEFAVVDTGLPDFNDPAPESDRLFVRGREN